MTAALICGMLGCLCYGGGDWLMMYGDTAHDGSVYWLTRGVAQIPAWRNTLAMDCAALVLYYDIIRIFMVECGQLCRGGAAAWRGCVYSFFMVSACQWDFDAAAFSVLALSSDQAKNCFPEGNGIYQHTRHLFFDVWYKKHDAGLSVPDWFYKWSDEREHDYLVRDHAGVESMQETGRRKMKGKECGFETEKIGRGLP